MSGTESPGVGLVILAVLAAFWVWANRGEIWPYRYEVRIVWPDGDDQPIPSSRCWRLATARVYERDSCRAQRCWAAWRGERPSMFAYILDLQTGEAVR